MARAPLCLLLAFSVLLDGHPGGPEPSAETGCPWPESGRRPPASRSSEEPRPDHRRCLHGETRREEPSLPSARGGGNWSTILVFIIIASIALVSVGIYFFYPQIRTCLRSCLQQQVQEVQQIQQGEVEPPLGLSVINFHAFDGASVGTDPRTPRAEDAPGPCDLPPVSDGTPVVVQLHCACVGVSKDKVVILSPEVPPNRDLPAIPTAL